MSPSTRERAILEAVYKAQEHCVRRLTAAWEEDRRGSPEWYQLLLGSGVRWYQLFPPDLERARTALELMRQQMMALGVQPSGSARASVESGEKVDPPSLAGTPFITPLAAPKSDTARTPKGSMPLRSPNTHESQCTTPSRGPIRAFPSPHGQDPHPESVATPYRAAPSTRAPRASSTPHSSVGLVGVSGRSRVVERLSGGIARMWVGVRTRGQRAVGVIGRDRSESGSKGSVSPLWESGSGYPAHELVYEDPVIPHRATDHPVGAHSGSPPLRECQGRVTDPLEHPRDDARVVRNHTPPQGLDMVRAHDTHRDRGVTRDIPICAEGLEEAASSAHRDGYPMPSLELANPSVPHETPSLDPPIPVSRHPSASTLHPPIGSKDLPSILVAHTLTSAPAGTITPTPSIPAAPTPTPIPVRDIPSAVQEGSSPGQVRVSIRDGG